MPVDHQRRVGQVSLQDRLERGVGLGHRRVGQLVLGMGRREAAGQQHPVLLPQRDVEVVAEPQDHPARRLGPPGLDIAEVPGRDVRPVREVELRQVPALPPLAQQLTDLPGASDMPPTVAAAQVHPDMTSDVIDAAHARRGLIDPTTNREEHHHDH